MQRSSTVGQFIPLHLPSLVIEIGVPLEDPSTPRSNGEILQKTAKVSISSLSIEFLTHTLSVFQYLPDKNQQIQKCFFFLLDIKLSPT